MSSVSEPCQVACSGKSPAAVRGAALALLAVHGLLLALSIPKNAVTYDEFTHLPVGMSYWQRGEFWPYHHNPPLVRMLYALPAVLLDVPIDYRNFSYVPGSRAAEYNLGRDFMLRNRKHYLRIYTICRLVVAGLSVLGGWLVFRWSRELFGNAGALVSLTLWTFSPNVLAHAGLATPDVGATVIGFLATYVFWRCLRCGPRGCACCFRASFPEVLGINYELPPFDGPAPGLQAVSAYYLLGISMSAPNGKGSVTSIPSGALVYYRRFQPIAIPGNSIYVYDLTLDEVNRVRRELGVPPWPDNKTP